MADHRALYRTWRPRSFAEVVGQDHVTRTLRNAISAGRLSHAYLFSGPRGTGKTSVAKILARTANCKAPSGTEACNACAVCTSIAAGNSLDVIEIDAASNRGIDEIRDLREKVKYPPIEARYKFYIIDEVHMLTAEAFNALLKTLEEPPPHAVFVLATTESHKIPMTILSRCQRFDFHRLTTREIAGRLAQVARESGIAIDDEAIDALARSAEGALRDALSLLDQVLAYAGQDRVTLDTTLRVLGTAPLSSFSQLLRAVAGRDGRAVLEEVERLVTEGKDIRQYVRDFVAFLRDVLLVQSLPKADGLLLTAGATPAALAEDAGLLGPASLLEWMKQLAALDQELKWSDQPRLLLETQLLALLATPADAMQEMAATASAAPPPPIRTAPPASAAAPPAVPDIVALWPQIQQAVRKKSVALSAFLLEAEPQASRPPTMVLSFKFEFHRDRVAQRENREILESVLRKMWHPEATVRCVMRSAETGGASPTPPPEASGKAEDDDPLQNPVVRAAIELFGGQVRIED